VRCARRVSTSSVEDMLTRADLEAIRRIVREEIRAAASMKQGVPDALPTAGTGTSGPEIDEWATDIWAASRGDPAAQERLDRRKAREVLAGDAWWLGRVRKFCGVPRRGVVNEADVVATLRHYRERRSRAREPVVSPTNQHEGS
jgi:hypothetical protein